MASRSSDVPSVRLRTVWNWLPVFRLVAEKQSVRVAAQLLHVAPSAVSRSVRLLEAELGVALFERRGRTLTLSDEGSTLLAFVRRAMRRIDDGIEATRGEAPLRFGVLDWLAPLFAPQLAGLRVQAQPSLAVGLEAVRLGRLEGFLAPRGPSPAGVLPVDLGLLSFDLHGLGVPTDAGPTAIPLDAMLEPNPDQPREAPLAELLCADTDRVLLPSGHPFAHGLRLITPRASVCALVVYLRADRARRPRLELVMSAVRAALGTAPAAEGTGPMSR